GARGLFFLLLAVVVVETRVEGLEEGAPEGAAQVDGDASFATGEADTEVLDADGFIVPVDRSQDDVFADLRRDDLRSAVVGEAGADDEIAGRDVAEAARGDAEGALASEGFDGDVRENVWNVEVEREVVHLRLGVEAEPTGPEGTGHAEQLEGAAHFRRDLFRHGD